MRFRAAVISALAFLALSGAALAYTADPRLDEAASWLAMRPVEVRCYSVEENEAPFYVGAWGYVKRPLGQASYAALDDLLCEGALNLNDELVPVWQRGLGVLVLAHESYHLRRWGANRDEAKVECKAIRHWKATARRLGATEETVAELWPTALAAHYTLVSYRDRRNAQPYYDPACQVPPLGIPEHPVP